MSGPTETAGAAAPYAADYYGHRHGFTERFCMERRFARMAAALPIGAPRRVLDIGCGSGAFLTLARARGFEGAGTELAPEAARAAGLAVEANLAALRGGAAFGVVTLWHSLEHMADPAALLAEARALMHPQGVLLVAVPDARCAAALLLGRHWLHRDAPHHLQHFSPRSLDRVLMAAGFTTLRRLGGEAEYDLVGWSQSLLDALGLPPQAFLRVVTGKSRAAWPLRALHFALGALASVLCVPAWLLCVLLRRPGTLVRVAVPAR